MFLQIKSVYVQALKERTTHTIKINQCCCVKKYTKITGVNLSTFASRLLHEDFFSIFRANLHETACKQNLHETACKPMQIN